MAKLIIRDAKMVSHKNGILTKTQKQLRIVLILLAMSLILNIYLYKVH